MVTDACGKTATCAQVITVNDCDIDEDNDGIPDTVENYYGDHDDDGTPDYADPDFCTDNFAGINAWDCADGLPDPDDDLDGDGTPNYMDADFPTCGGLNSEGVCTNFDNDGDGHPNHDDLDADNDGIPDVIEAGGEDPDNDGIVGTGAPTDSDGDGLPDAGDPDGASTTNTSGQDDTTLPVADFDEDDLPNFLDLDADGDGIVDIIEAGGEDEDGNGVVDGTTTTTDPQADTNDNGWADGLEGAGNGHDLPNTDGNGNSNWLDIDADDDGITDNIEGQSTDGFDMAGTDDGTGGFVAPSGNDTDGDGIDDAYDNDPGNFGGSGIDSDVTAGAPIAPHDHDGDGIPDYLDPDSDEDGSPDALEGHDYNLDGEVDDDLTACTAIGAPDYSVPVADADGDGLLDCYDAAAPTPDVTQVGAGTGNCPLGGGCTPEDTMPGDDDTEPDFRDNDTDVLPLELKAFTATVEDCVLGLHWETFAEVDFAYFSIERSPDGINFRMQGQVLATGSPTTTAYYTWTDERPTGLNYYRLKMVDLDGSFRYSPLVTINYDCYENGAITMLYPVPTSQEITFDFYTEDNAPGQIKVIDMLGRVLIDETADFTRGINTHTLLVRNLPAAAYVLSIEIKGKRLGNKPFIKID